MPVPEGIQGQGHLWRLSRIEVLAVCPMLNAVPAEHQISQSKALMTDSKVAVIAGYGVGISAAAAKRFGQEGYKLALLARTQSRLDQAVAGMCAIAAFS